MNKRLFLSLSVGLISIMGLFFASRYRPLKVFAQEKTLPPLSNIIYTEDFASDVFSNGDWTRSNQSVFVDTVNGTLHFDANSIVTDLAQKAMDLPLPFVFETRVRLVSGGRGYWLPAIYFSADTSDAHHINIVYGGCEGCAVEGGWWFGPMSEWPNYPYIYTHKLPSDNVWTTLRGEIRVDGGELWGKFDNEQDFTYIMSNNWSLPDHLDTLYFQQPWDAVMDIDYIRISSQSNVRQIAFSSNQSGDYDIYIINSDGSGLINLTNSPGVNEFVQDWSPDGTKLLYAEDYGGGNVAGLNIFDVQTKQTTRLISGWSDGAKWSPDGKKIVYTCPQNGIDICIFDIETGQTADLTTDNPWKDRLPAWSNTGNKIIWSRECGGYGLYRLYVMDASGENKTKVTSDDIGEGAGSWSHDGTTIAYHARVGESWQLYIIPANGGESTRLTFNNDAVDFEPRFSPDDSQLLYYKYIPDTGYDISIYDFSSGSEKLLYSSPADDLNPVWKPAVHYGTNIPYGWRTISATNFYHHAGGFAYYEGHAYAVGGWNGTGPTSLVEYAAVQPTGDIGPWMQTSSLVQSSYATAAVAAKGHLYLLGGLPTSQPVWSNVVQVARINPDGSLDEWRKTSPMNLNRDNLGAVVIGNYIYAIGGSPEWKDQNSVEFAEILPNGDLGPWQFTTAMNRIRKAVTVAASINCIYALGGGTGDLSDSTNTVERACAYQDGTLGNWEYQTSMNYARSYASAVVWQNKLIAMGGTDNRPEGTFIRAVEVAEIGQDGSLGVWTAGEDLLHSWGGLGSFVTERYIYAYGGMIDYFPNLTLNVDRADLMIDGLPVIVNTVSPTFTPVIIETATSTPQSIRMPTSTPIIIDASTPVQMSTQMVPATVKPAVTQKSASAIPYGWETISTTTYRHNGGGFVSYNGYVYIIGGADGTAVTTTVEYAPVLPNGDIGKWRETSPLDTPSYGGEAVVAKGHVYYVGGRPVLPPVWSNSVQLAEINSDGTLGKWHQTSPLNLDRDNLGVVVVGDYIYAIGGSPEWNDQDSVEFAKISSDGQLTSWVYTTSMNRIRKHVTTATDGKCIYAIGGGTADLRDSTNTVERACPNPDGTLGNWEYQTSMNNPRSVASAVVWQDKLIVMGGFDGYSVLDSVEVAMIGKNGDLGEWTQAEPLRSTWNSPETIATDRFIYALGGTQDGEEYPTYNVDRAILATNNPSIIRYVLYGVGGLVAACIAIAIIYFVAQFFLSLRKYRSRGS